jgi:hypothetical protein
MPLWDFWNASSQERRLSNFSPGCNATFFWYLSTNPLCPKDPADTLFIDRLSIVPALCCYLDLLFIETAPDIGQSSGAFTVIMV